jgi:hypothetical protein
MKKVISDRIGKLMAFLVIAFVWTSAWAVDASSRLTDTMKIGRWQVMEIAADRQLIYRIGATSSNEPTMNITFDFVPMLNCAPKAATLIMQLDEYDATYDDGAFVLSYKVPGKKESTEFLQSSITQGDTWAFFNFNQLSPALLQSSNGKGSLAIWIPASGDGVIKRGSNIYFTLAGFPESFRLAQKKCRESL